MCVDREYFVLFEELSFTEQLEVLTQYGFDQHLGLNLVCTGWALQLMTLLPLRATYQSMPALTSQIDLETGPRH